MASGRDASPNDLRASPRAIVAAAVTPANADRGLTDRVPSRWSTRLPCRRALTFSPSSTLELVVQSTWAIAGVAGRKPTRLCTADGGPLAFESVGTLDQRRGSKLTWRPPGTSPRVRPTPWADVRGRGRSNLEVKAEVPLSAIGMPSLLPTRSWCPLLPTRFGPGTAPSPRPSG